MDELKVRITGDTVGLEQAINRSLGMARKTTVDLNQAPKDAAGQYANWWGQELAKRGEMELAADVKAATRSNQARRLLRQREMDREMREREKFEGSFLGRAKESFVGMGMAMAGAFGLERLVSGMFEASERFTILSKQFRVSTDEVQRWDAAAKRAGMDAGDLGSALIRLERARHKAIEGNNAGAFGDFGISLAQLKDSKIDTKRDLPGLIQKGMGGGSDAKDAAAIELLGRSGARTLAVFRELKELGPIMVMDPKAVRDIHEAGEELENAERGTKSLLSKLYLLSLKYSGAGIAARAAGTLWAGGNFKGFFGGESPSSSGEAGETVGDVSAKSGRASKLGKDEVINELYLKRIQLSRELRQVNLFTLDEMLAKGAELEEVQKRIALASAKDGVEKLKLQRGELVHELELENRKFAKNANSKEGRGRYRSLMDDISVMDLRIADEEERKAKPDKPGTLGDLKYGKELEYHPDSLAKIGAFTSSSLAFNPLLSVQKEQVVVLHKILDKLPSRPAPNPFQ